MGKKNKIHINHYFFSFYTVRHLKWEIFITTFFIKMPHKSSPFCRESSWSCINNMFRYILIQTCIKKKKRT